MSRKASFYAALICAVGPVYAFVLLAWSFLVFSVWSGRLWTYTLRWRIALVWAALEVVFTIYHKVLALRINSTPPRIPPDLGVLHAAFAKILNAGMANLHDLDADASANLQEEEEQVEKELGPVPRLIGHFEPVPQLDFNDPRARDFRERIRTWFHKKPWSQIHTHEMRQWLYWSTFNGRLPPEAELSPLQRSALNDALTLIQRRAGATIKQGSNPACPPILLTIDPVSVHPRPLIYYTFIWIANIWIRHYLQRRWGLIYGKCGDFEYLVRLPKNTNPESALRPLIFLHGLGLGLFQYNIVLRNILPTLRSCPILIPLQPHISQNIFHRRFLNPLSEEESVHSLTQIIREFGWEGCGVDILSHSNGTFFHAWMLKSFPKQVKRSCFIDPVTFCLWEGDLCYNFVHRRCVTGFELVIRYFVGTELGVANFIQRQFDWSANALWFEEIPNAADPKKAAFFLGGRDCIVDAVRVKRYLHSHGIHKGLWFDPEGRHGEALIAGGEGLQRVLEWLLDED